MACINPHTQPALAGQPGVFEIIKDIFPHATSEETVINQIETAIFDN